MGYTDPYITSVIRCGEQKLLAASSKLSQIDSLGIYRGNEVLQDINSIRLYLSVIRTWDNRPYAINNVDERELRMIIDALLRLPYPCEFTATGPGTPGGTINRLPVVDAGINQSLAAGSIAASLSGSAVDPDGQLLSLLWTKVSGGPATINSPTTLVTTVTGLQAGTYVFRLTATDPLGATSYDDVQITIAQALDAFYWGRYPSTDVPVDKVAMILAGNKFTGNGTNDITVPLHQGATGPAINWVAIPNITPLHNKNQWFENMLNKGEIGAFNTFGTPTVHTVEGISYLLYVNSFATQFANAIIFKKV